VLSTVIPRLYCNNVVLAAVHYVQVEWEFCRLVYVFLICCCFSNCIFHVDIYIVIGYMLISLKVIFAAK